VTCRVYAGDCREFMAKIPDRAIDHVITDPPYRPIVHRNSRKGSKNAVSEMKDFGYEPITPKIRSDVTREFARIAKRWIIVFCDAESVTEWMREFSFRDIEYVRCGIWLKEAGTPQFTGDRPGIGHECIVIGHAPRESGRMRWNGGGRPAVWKARVVRDAIHSTQKPLELMEALVRDFTERGDRILDPFAGSGTTIAAAKRWGREGLGVELNPEWAKAANRRIADISEQAELELPQGAKAKQEDLL